MNNINDKKIKFEQKKARLIAEETKLKLNERKQRTRNLIELGGLVTKAELDILPVNALYGALLFLKETLHGNKEVVTGWIAKGKIAFDEEKKDKLPIIIKMVTKPELKIRSLLREHGLKWNYLRQEWYGYVNDIGSLKNGLVDIEYKIEDIIE